MPYADFVKIVNGQPTIDIGAMRHTVSIKDQGPSSPPEYDAGGRMIPWHEVATGNAAIAPVRGIDVIRGGQSTSQLFLTVAMWWDPAIRSNMRVYHDNGSIYKIESVENVLEADVVLVLNCTGLEQNL